MDRCLRGDFRLSEVQPAETPYENEVEDGPDESWGLAEGDEICPGRYALAKLGGGSDYEAYLAWDDRLSYLVVAKLLRPHLLEHEGARRALEREAHALARLNHPMIVRGYGTELRAERPHLVMEHLEGPHLARLIRRFGPLPLEQLVPLAINLCAAVHYLGEEGLVHLDIKPRNVVVGIPPKLIDLSVARSVSRAERITGHVGTDLYMAPEQCEPNVTYKIGRATDVWGLGATLYHAAAGRRPFERANEYDAEDLTQRFPQLNTDPPPLAGPMPAPIVDAISACLRRDPAERPAAREVAEMLEPVLAALPRRQRLGRLRPRIRRERGAG